MADSSTISTVTTTKQSPSYLDANAINVKSLCGNNGQYTKQQNPSKTL